MKRWTIDFQDYNENVIETIEIAALSREEAEEVATSRSLRNKAHTFSVTEDHRWIKSKVAVILGLYNQYAGMCVVDNQTELDELKEMYSAPYSIKIIEDIPNLKDFLRPHG